MSNLDNCQNLCSSLQWFAYTHIAHVCRAAGYFKSRILSWEKLQFQRMIQPSMPGFTLRFLCIRFDSWFLFFTCFLPFYNELQDKLSGEVKVKGFQNWLSICQLFVVVFFLFYYSLLVYLVCIVFLIRKAERRGK